MSKLSEFLHQKEILKQLRHTCASGKTSLVLDFDKFLEFNLELARSLLYNPTETLSEADHELEQITKIPGMCLRVRDLDKTFTVDDLRAEHIDKFVQIQGTATMVGFNKLLRIEGYNETRDFEDFQRLLLDDCLNVVLKGGLVGSVKEGDKVTITGWLGAVNEGSVYGYGLVANHIEVFNGHGSGQDAGGTSGPEIAEVPDVRPDPCLNCGSTEIEELPFEGFPRCKECGRPGDRDCEEV